MTSALPVVNNSEFAIETQSSMSNASMASLETRRLMRLVEPATPGQLHAYVRAVLGFVVPTKAIVEGNAAPFDYVQHAFFENNQPRDCIVWANRGGGKTQLGAVVTLLELLFKPGIQIRILGGSFEQSSKMYQYLKHLLEDDCFSDLIAGRITGRAVSLKNGSCVEVLSQSERAVRGQRVHKLRCDEVELFEPEVWEAAQMVTRSGRCGETHVNGTIETLSTMHRPYGMMQKLIQRATEQNRKVFRWSVLDTLEKCPPQRLCDGCKLWDDCRGEAKHANGFISIDDAIQQMRRVGPETWKAEMLCEQPSRSTSVYPAFDRKVHVRCFEGTTVLRSVSEGSSHLNSNRPGRRLRSDEAVSRSRLGEPGYVWIGGMDFGYRSPTVLLWAFVDDDQTLWVVDELYIAQKTTDQIIAIANEKRRPRPQWIGADPAGHQRQEHTGTSTIALWKNAGWPIKTQQSTIEAGIALVSRRLKRADGSVGLYIHERCEHLIQAMVQYHYPPDKPERSEPVKDGHDHAADALRYMILNLDRPGRVEVRKY